MGGNLPIGYKFVAIYGRWFGLVGKTEDWLLMIEIIGIIGIVGFFEPAISRFGRWAGV
jgi:hypothetical protein